MSDAAGEDLIVLSVRCPLECAEAVHAAFHEAGIPGTVEQRCGKTATVTGYMPASSRWTQALAEISDRLVAVREIFGADIDGPAATVLPATDWTEAWKKDYKLVRVGRIVIKPSWLAAPADEAIVVELDPQMAFGSGAHSSTRLALQALQDVELRGARVADVGTGTGILAIAAALMGAAKVYAIDYDPIAVRAARSNVRRNGVAAVIEVVAGDLLGAAPRRLDGIVANISPAADIELARQAPEYLRRRGWLILSGFTEASEERVAEAARQGGFSVQRRYSEGEWVCLTGRLMAER